jgi:hypothetical protein
MMTLMIMLREKREALKPEPDHYKDAAADEKKEDDK